MTVKHGSKPIVVDEVCGTHAYCQCGNSARLPYCDGSHTRIGAGVGPMMASVETAGKKSVCQCHRSAALPWCDGTHKHP